MNASAATADGLSLSLIGVPNCGKTALFNRLTGSHQKVANYPGVTVERKEGRFTGPLSGRTYRVLDLPGAYSLEPTSLDNFDLWITLQGQRVSLEVTFFPGADGNYAWFRSRVAVAQRVETKASTAPAQSIRD